MTKWGHTVKMFRKASKILPDKFRHIPVKFKDNINYKIIGL